MPAASHAAASAGLVLEEGAELAPACRAVDERQLANGDAAELHPHRQGDDVQAIEEVGRERPASMIHDVIVRSEFGNHLSVLTAALLG